MYQKTSHEWRALRERRKLSDPEHIVALLSKTDFYCPKEKRMKPMTRYRLAKETGVSWHTIQRATSASGLDYQWKTKRRLKKFVQPY